MLPHNTEPRKQDGNSTRWDSAEQFGCVRTVASVACNLCARQAQGHLSFSASCHKVVSWFPPATGQGLTSRAEDQPGNECAGGFIDKARKHTQEKGGCERLGRGEDRV